MSKYKTFYFWTEEEAISKLKTLPMNVKTVPLVLPIVGDSCIKEAEGKVYRKWTLQEKTRYDICIEQD